jgi:hypothetical protein
MRVRHEERSADDGYRSMLVPGLRASADAQRLAEEIAFAEGRLRALSERPPGLYGEARELAASHIERATWICFLVAYLSPLPGDDPFASVSALLALAPAPAHIPPIDELDELPLGPRSAHQRGRGTRTLEAYAQWLQRAGAPEGSQQQAFTGDPQWSPPRRFERLFERLSLPGFGRSARFELLVTLGRLGLYPLQADSLHLSGARGSAADDATTLAAKRVFGIGDAALLDRRAAELARAAWVPVEALDVALANWAAPERATLGVAGDVAGEDARARALHALGL